ncbi:hypothetical protein HYN59_08850 [Flavobacterium album]|uniref:Uncharacterized protein n=1 Tax=Flavobacterium album TaxID=2175091 RepID=A0A2S1QY04_9FLAO|nr:hypothetical protein [Flavobacterium album]AWH85219.1 hypothetical protein HYN59_08850 [Flavobacterium album]
MYQIITPVTENHNPIIVEGNLLTQTLLFNAGPSVIEAQVWHRWRGKEKGKFQEDAYEPNFKIELRPGNQKIVTGSFIRVGLKQIENSNEEKFAAIGSRTINHTEREIYFYE